MIDIDIVRSLKKERDLSEFEYYFLFITQNEGRITLILKN